MDLGLKGKVALVTAASRGIGFAVANRLAAEGAIVAVNARTAEALGEAFDPLKAGGASISLHPGDLSGAGTAQRILDTVLEKHGRLDVLVMNTPGPRIVPFLETRAEDWSDAYDALVRPALTLAHGAATAMVRQGGGSIIFITSTWVKQPMAGGVLSASFRGLLSTLAKQMALELAPLNVRVNQVMPGATGTARMKGIVAAKAAKYNLSEKAVIEDIVSQIPLGRWADPVEIADTIAFLASPVSAFTTGVALAVDGGAIRSTL